MDKPIHARLPNGTTALARILAEDSARHGSGGGAGGRAAAADEHNRQRDAHPGDAH